MKFIDLNPLQVKALLNGATGLEVPLPDRWQAGEEVRGREAWRGWNCAAPDQEQDQLDETLDKVLASLKSFTSRIRETKEFKDAVKSAERVKEARKPRGGWADIDYRADGLRTRIHGLTLEQTYEARVVGEIDVGLTRDPWREPEEMPEWASRFRFKAESIRRVEGGHIVFLRRLR